MAHLQESLSGVRIVTAHNRQRRNVAEHRTIVMRYRDANDVTATVGATYGGITETVGMAGQIVILVIGGQLGARRHDGDRPAGGLHPLPRGVLRADPAARAALQHVPAGSGVGAEAPRPARRGALGRRPTRCAGPPRAGGGGAARGRGVRVRPRPPGAARRRPGDPRRRDPRLRRRDRRRQVHHRQARQPPLRPRRPAGCSSTASTCATSPCARCGGRWAPCRRSRSCSRGSIRANVTFARPDATEAEVLEACRLVGLGDLLDRLPDGHRHPRARARRVAVVRRASAPRAGSRVPRSARGSSCSTRRRRTST